MFVLITSALVFLSGRRIDVVVRVAGFILLVVVTCMPPCGRRSNVIVFELRCGAREDVYLPAEASHYFL